MTIKPPPRPTFAFVSGAIGLSEDDFALDFAKAVLAETKRRPDSLAKAINERASKKLAREYEAMLRLALRRREWRWLPSHWKRFESDILKAATNNEPVQCWVECLGRSALIDAVFSVEHQGAKAFVALSDGDMFHATSSFNDIYIASHAIGLPSRAFSKIYRAAYSWQSAIRAVSKPQMWD